MKLVKSAAGKDVLQITQSEWLKIGQTNWPSEFQNWSSEGGPKYPTSLEDAVGGTTMGEPAAPSPADEIKNIARQIGSVDVGDSRFAVEQLENFIYRLQNIVSELKSS
jgi:hypothetical protein